ncbi:hypothetical protein SAMN05444411_11158 [Lutibacter oricola]|uniref:Uncharacterized protein n=1 Tax=Lutibacter oricola TaxID=762486 RepID=A0A1H3FHI6_9FLAO|nr:hypothetical protein [Lutibacter oricola]SDX90481.1 hypothetical protein SAMN05444411_11158 [Lutibacter oricola]
MDTIKQINKVIEEYFKTHKEDWIAAKDIMPALVEAGVFVKDYKKGLPLRKVLRALDKDNSLDKIPFIHAERKEKNVYWYIVRKGAAYKSQEILSENSKRSLGVKKRENSDEYYILNLCDAIFNEKASRQHTFPFLLGDFHKDKITRTKLPLDAYYHSLNLVIEYRGKPVEAVEESKHRTISGVSRDKQRKLYDQRRRDVLLRKNINLIEVHYYSFEYNDDGNIVRDEEKNIEVLKEILKDFLK